MNGESRSDPGIGLAIGPQTSRILKKKWNIQRIYIPKKFNALQAAHTAHSLNKSQGNRMKILWLGAENGVTAGIEYLKKARHKVDHYTAYKNESISKNELKKLFQLMNLNPAKTVGSDSIWIFTSPSTANSYLKNGLHRENHSISCLGNTTASFFFKK